MASTMEYVIHGGLIYDADDWFNSHDADRYDDIKQAIVNLDHPDYPDDDEKLYEDLGAYWETGTKPSYVI